MYNFDKPFNRRNTNCWKWDAEGKNAKFAMGCADTDFRIPEPVAKALHAKIDEGALTYICDCDNVFLALANYWKRQYDVTIDKDSICNCIGSMVGLRVMLDAYTHAGDAIIIQTPVFNYFKDTAENYGRKVIDNTMIYNREKGEYEINFEELEEFAKNPRVKMMVICNPANPTGKVYTKEELEKIGKICCENNIILLSDEIHSDFYFNNHKHTSVLSLNDKIKQNSIMLTGTGKTFNIHGFYTAFIVIPNNFIRTQFKIAYQNLRLDVIDMGLVAAEAAYNHCDDYVIEMRKYIAKNIEYATNFFKEKNIKVKLVKPNSTYLLWLDFLDWNLTSDELDKLFKKYGLVLTRGSLFGKTADGFMRMDIATQLANVTGALELIETIYNENIKGENK
ncbi:aminotransferase class I/II-fold pyridoxal phosphate-dependent enzyme [Fusobacterium sp. SYSU M8D902]|uniref:MalY/PatB family protein n=1 Tax=Fusobacterium sp. SYSU M8D902 TaxID=3159562 RepID=UPI0032E47C89